MEDEREVIEKLRLEILERRREKEDVPMQGLKNT